VSSFLGPSAPSSVSASLAREAALRSICRLYRASSSSFWARKASKVGSANFVAVLGSTAEEAVASEAAAGKSEARAARQASSGRLDIIRVVRGKAGI
jgi:hypothetical protein